MSDAPILDLRDQELRIIALGHAVALTQTAMRSSDDCDPTDESVVAAAETFYAFLSASSDTSDQARSGAETQTPRPE